MTVLSCIKILTLATLASSVLAQTAPAPVPGLLGAPKSLRDNLANERSNRSSRNFATPEATPPSKPWHCSHCPLPG